MKADIQRPQLHAQCSSAASQVVIDVQTLSKSYHIYDRPQDRLKQALVTRLVTLRSRIAGIFLPGGAPRPPVYYREFWALRDVSLQVRRGETLGIIERFVAVMNARAAAA